MNVINCYSSDNKVENDPENNTRLIKAPEHG
jgi:hypothetical protein